MGWLRANPPRPRGAGASFTTPGLPTNGGQPQANGLCPRSYPSTTLRCHTMPNLFEFTVCEQCYAEVIRPDVSRASELARQFDPNPSLMPSGFTCQLYSDRMRRVWSEAGSTGNLEYLRQKVGPGSICYLYPKWEWKRQWRAEAQRLNFWFHTDVAYNPGARAAGQGARVADEDRAASAASQPTPCAGPDTRAPGGQLTPPCSQHCEQQYNAGRGGCRLPN